MPRCPWCGTDPLYVRYHDEEWGRPERDGRALFEALVLESFQAGLSWYTILSKREGFRKAFDGFDPSIIAEYDEKKIEKLLENKGIIRHRGKIKAAITAAQLYIEIEAEQGFSNYIWSFVDGKPIDNKPQSMHDVPAAPPIAHEMSKALKKRGFKFVGPSITYAFMQATGLVNDHLQDCEARLA